METQDPVGSAPDATQAVAKISSDDQSKPKPKRKLMRNRWTPRQVDEALTLYGGDRKRAADHLGVTLEQLKGRIYHHEWLTVKWSKEAIAARRAQDAQATIETPETLMERMIVEQNQQMGLNANRILQQLKLLEKRMELDQKAKENPNDTELKQHRFRDNVRGEPTEEAMVRQQYNELLDQYRRIIETSQQAVWIKAKIAALLRKFGPQSPGGRRRSSLGLPPKSAVYEHLQTNVGASPS